MIQLSRRKIGFENLAGLIRKVTYQCMRAINTISSGSDMRHVDRGVNLAIVGRLALGAGKSLTLVEVGSHRYLIAAGNENISAILLLKDDVSVASIGLTA